jgi:FlaA1/EpsC-like NDP-sugar epimerase
MGQPVNIHDLACSLIRFYGFEPEKDIPIHITGLRIGERLHERLFCADDIVRPTVHEGILNVKRQNHLAGSLSALLESLKKIVFFNPEAENQYMNRKILRQTLQAVVPTLGDLPGEPEY